MKETFYYFFNIYYKFIIITIISIISIWIFISILERLINKYYGYQKYSFSRTYLQNNRTNRSNKIEI